jgi:phosphoribosylamine--glycine ligase
MRVLLIGSGGREHALAWAISGSPLLSKLWVAPGNPGTAELAENVPIGVGDIAALVEFARDNQVDLVVPGPEAPLVAGLADALMLANIKCCGPSAAAARLEGSKAFTKEICDQAGIPTARWERFENPADAVAFVRRRGAPIVVKADGLAAGKGVIVAATEAEAEAAIHDLTALGDAGATLVIEEALVGVEVSVFALCDGTNAIPLGVARDHKRAGDGDTGPNTGGMGAVSSPDMADPAFVEGVMTSIIRPALAAMAARDTPFRGVLFAGLMLTAEGAKLIEFNVRLGDPECQALVLRLRSDLLAAFVAACDGELDAFDVRWHDRAAVAVVMAARGYPGAVTRGTGISGLARAALVPDTQIFHAGTKLAGDRLVADGGRVLTVCGTGPTVAEARAAAYRAVGEIDWPDGFCRADIAASTPG